MSWKRTFTRIWRWSLIVDLFVGGYWLVYYLQHGNIPAPTTFGFMVPYQPAGLALTIGVSRLFDLLVAPVMISFIVGILNIPEGTSIEITDADLVIFILWLMFFVGLITGILGGIVTGIFTIVVLDVTVGLIYLLIKFFWWICLRIINWANAN